MKREREQKVTTNMSFHSKLSKKSIQIFESNEEDLRMEDNFSKSSLKSCNKVYFLICAGLRPDPVRRRLKAGFSMQLKGY